MRHHAVHARISALMARFPVARSPSQSSVTGPTGRVHVGRRRSVLTISQDFRGGDPDQIARRFQSEIEALATKMPKFTQDGLNRLFSEMVDAMHQAVDHFAEQSLDNAILALQVAMSSRKRYRAYLTALCNEEIDSGG